MYRAACEIGILERDAAAAAGTDPAPANAEVVKDALRYVARAVNLLEHVLSVCAVELEPRKVQLGM